MLFSIVVPVYNVEKYLDECIQSILEQTNTINNDCEILLIDDGSTDMSGEICDSYSQQFPQLIKVYHKENQGLLATRRYGFQRTCGEYVINCDSDDLLENRMLESVKRIIIKYKNPDIVFINNYRYDGKNRIVLNQDIFGNVHDTYVNKEDVLSKFMSGHSIVSVCGKVIKRSCIDIDRDYNEYGRLSTGEDTLQSIEFFSKAQTFVYLNEPLYDYRCGSGMTAKYDPNYFSSFSRIMYEIKNHKCFLELKPFEKLYAIKVLQTAGRGITQSRYNQWKSYREHKKYLMSIRETDLFIKNIKYIDSVKNKLQFDHYVLLKMLNYNLYFFICILLRIKNRVS